MIICRVLVPRGAGTARLSRVPVRGKHGGLSGHQLRRRHPLHRPGPAHQVRGGGHRAVRAGQIV